MRLQRHAAVRRCHHSAARLSRMESIAATSQQGSGPARPSGPCRSHIKSARASRFPRPDSDVTSPLHGQVPHARWHLWTCCRSIQQVQVRSTGVPGPLPPGRLRIGDGPQNRVQQAPRPPGLSWHRKPLQIHGGTPSPASPAQVGTLLGV